MFKNEIKKKKKKKKKEKDRNSVLSFRSNGEDKGKT